MRDIMNITEGFDQFLQRERERIAALPAYHDALRRKEMKFFDAAVTEIRAICPEAQIISLFGSRAENTAKRTSDWDFLAIVPSDTDGDRYLELTRAGRRLKTLMGRKVDVQFAKPDGTLVKSGTHLPLFQS